MPTIQLRLTREHDDHTETQHDIKCRIYRLATGRIHKTVLCQDELTDQERDTAIKLALQRIEGLI